MTDRIRPCLWFERDAEPAAAFYVSLLPNSRITQVARTPEGGRGTPGSVLMVAFELDGRPFQALNGGVDFPFSEAVSLSVACPDQAEIDRLWAALAEGGTPQRCGWIKDRWGLPWQIVPEEMGALMSAQDPAAAARVMAALTPMVKIDLEALRRAHAGGS